ncbi:MAG: heme d1 biosynthesis protein NirF [Rhodospirillaceae bacterium]|nr:MAG: heme d1 biosynthesis protein NirF [Rhodospirillaceae bacterium]
MMCTENKKPTLRGAIGPSRSPFLVGASWALATAVVLSGTTHGTDLQALRRHDCGACHGLTLQGGLGPPLTRETLASRDDAGLIDTILDDHPGTPMPAWAPLLSREQAAQMVRLLLGTETEEARETLALVIERASGSILVIDATIHTVLGRIKGLGDLSHASMEFSRDGRYAFVFGRNGGLTKLDLKTRQIVARVLQSGNSIGGALSRDGRFVAVANYTPGGVRVFETATLASVADIPAISRAGGAPSKVVGLVSAPGARFVFSLFEAGEIWLLDLADPLTPKIQRYQDAGPLPYDAFLTPDGRSYIAGLFGTEAMTLLDLERPGAGARRILDGYRKGESLRPVYKMPHLEGWTVAGTSVLFPAVGAPQVLVADTTAWTLTDRIPVQGQPVFVVSRPDGREAWVNFALPDNDTIQVIDVTTRRVVRTLKVGRGILHMAFAPQGDAVWISSHDDDTIILCDPVTHEKTGTIPALGPSGIFFATLKTDDRGRGP